MAQKNRYNKGFTLAEVMVTIAVMGIVLALVTTFAAIVSKATQERSESSARLREIEKVNELITDWFYNFDDTDYTMLKVDNAEEKYVFDYVNDRAIKITPSEFTIQNKKYSGLENTGGIVPINYQLRFNIDSQSFHRVLTAVYSTNHSDDRSITLHHIKNIDFYYEEDLGILKCVYTYDDDENESQQYKYTYVLSRHT